MLAHAAPFDLLLRVETEVLCSEMSQMCDNLLFSLPPQALPWVVV